MCGIFGYQLYDAGMFSAGRRLLLSTALASLNDRRGGHSWGMVRFAENLDEAGPELEITRGVGEFADAVDQIGAPLSFFGHTRFATVGDKTVENAHPFEIGQIVGAHNGGISNHASLNEKYQRGHAVDSMHIFSHLAEGLDFSELEGYGSVVWTERGNPGVMYLCRMRGGELSVRGIGKYTKKRSQIYGVVFSSSEAHLGLALDRAGITEHFSFNLEMDRVYRISGADLYGTDRRLWLSFSTTLPKTQTWRNWDGSHYSWDGRGYNGSHYSQWDENTPIPDLTGISGGGGGALTVSSKNGDVRRYRYQKEKGGLVEVPYSTVSEFGKTREDSDKSAQMSDDSLEAQADKWAKQETEEINKQNEKKESRAGDLLVTSERSSRNGV